MDELVLTDARSFLLLTAETAPSTRRAARPDRVQRFATEQEARAAFIAARLSSCIERAELVAQVPGRSLRTLCWFGPDVGKAGARPPASVVPRIAPVGSRRPRRVALFARLFHGRR